MGADHQMRLLLSNYQMQTADEYTSKEIGIHSFVLMERAALAVADRICAVCAPPESGRPLRVAVICGKGNNGADAMAAGRILLDRGMEVTFYVEDDAPGYSLGEQQNIVRHYGVPLYSLSSKGCEEFGILADSMERLRTSYADIYVDGLFGIGLNREVTGLDREIIEAINEAAAHNHARVFAVDLPSGIHTGDGRVCGVAVRAAETVTFGFYKRGQFLYPGTTYCGHLTLADIGIPAWSYEHACRNEDYADPDPESIWFTYITETAEDLLPERAADGNKGTFGKGLIIAGDMSVSGAATMAASAAGRMGCGMVRVYTREENRTILQETVPEALLSVWSPDDMKEAVRQLESALAWCNTVAIGPGLGRSKETAHLLRTVLAYTGDHLHHMILDADAIRLIADYDYYELLAEAGSRCDVILTPHLAECAALLHVTVQELQADRESRIRAFAENHHVTLLCKDARSMAVNGSDNRTYLNTSGNDGLATAGSGDVLTGILTACTAQGLSGLDAAAAASYLHGRLAEQAEGETGRRGLVAPDLYRRLCGASAVVWSEEFGIES